MNPLILIASALISGDFVGHFPGSNIGCDVTLKDVSRSQDGSKIEVKVFDDHLIFKRDLKGKYSLSKDLNPPPVAENWGYKDRGTLTASGDEITVIKEIQFRDGPPGFAFFRRAQKKVLTFKIDGTAPVSVASKSYDGNKLGDYMDSPDYETGCEDLRSIR